MDIQKVKVFLQSLHSFIRRHPVAFLGLGFLIWGLLSFYTYNDLRSNGTVTLATVIDHRIQKKGDDFFHYITYQFQAPSADGDGTEVFEREAHVARSYYEDKKLGEKITITYSKRDPDKSCIGSCERQLSTTLWGIIIFVVLVLVEKIWYKPKKAVE